MSAQSIPKPDQDKVISLQIGEMYFSVSYGTFQKLKGDFEKKVLWIDDNKYFVDRDGKLFEYILRYLRHEIISFPENFKDGRMLLQEAKFFGLTELQNHLSNGAGEPEVITLLAMVPYEEANPHLRQMQPQGPGMDISLNWMGANSNQSGISWKDLLQGFSNKINFQVYEVKGIPIDCYKVHHTTLFSSELRNSSATVDKPYIVNVKDFTCVSILLNGFISIGFTLLMDRSSVNMKCFKKNYKSVRELTLRRIRPIWN